MTKLLIFAYGNLSRGDDALGPLVLQHVEPLKERHRWQHIELLSDFQLQVEHALDLRGHDLVLFIDASVSCRAPCGFHRLQAERDITYSSHAMSPSAVLFAYRQLYNSPPPAAFMLSIRGEQFELGEPLSQAAMAHLQAAVQWVETLCRQAQTTDLLAYCEQLTKRADGA